jgi:hypothetical protein
MKSIQSKKCIFVRYDLISCTCIAVLFWACFLLNIHGNILKTGAQRLKSRFAESSKEKKYEENCLRSSYIHNDNVSRKPIAQ